MFIVIPLGIATALGYAAYIRYMIRVRRTCECVYCGARR